ncbi:galectin-2 isoform 2-T13 [Theristicus caerulescens]
MQSVSELNCCWLPAWLLCSLRKMSEKFEIFNLDMKTGDTLKVKGKISDDADRFSINLGCSSSDLALHFNPRFDESVIVCNSRCSTAWQAEHRDNHLCFSKGSTIKIIIEMLEDKFRVKLPDEHEVEFPNRHSYSKICYMSVKGGFRVTSFKLD